MKIEDLQAQLLELQTKYDGLAETIKQKDELLEGFKTREEDFNNRITGYQEQVMRLRDMNTDLFLRVSQPVPDIKDPVAEDKPAPEPTVTLEDILG